LIINIQKISTFLKILHEAHLSGARFIHNYVLDVTPDKVILENGEEIPYEILVIATGI
jgi:hypothetical protein